MHKSWSQHQESEFYIKKIVTHACVYVNFYKHDTNNILQYDKININKCESEIKTEQVMINLSMCVRAIKLAAPGNFCYVHIKYKYFFKHSNRSISNKLNQNGYNSATTGAIP